MAERKRTAGFARAGGYRVPSGAAKAARRASSETAGGVGLGLALVRSIALRHGGQVRCLEAPGAGSCFEVNLPHRPATAGPKPASVGG